LFSRDGLTAAAASGAEELSSPPREETGAPRPWVGFDEPLLPAVDAPRECVRPDDEDEDESAESLLSAKATGISATP
jgi:hypothetical protein